MRHYICRHKTIRFDTIQRDSLVMSEQGLLIVKKSSACMPVDWQSSGERDACLSTPDSGRRHNFRRLSTATRLPPVPTNFCGATGVTTACLRLPPNFDSVAPACLRLQSQARNEAPARLSTATVSTISKPWQGTGRIPFP
eukprot:scaffold87467_cov30-Cyclotella_meneghiniana.AAC.1